METIAFSFSFAHHGKYSSFHRLCHYLNDVTVIDHTPHIPDWLPDKINRRMKRYWFDYADLRLKRYYQNNNPTLFHYLRPENSLRFGWKWKKKITNSSFLVINH